MLNRRFLQCLPFLALFLQPMQAHALEIDHRANPEGAGGAQVIEMAAQGQDFMIATANPLATQAGYKILERGGSAADAAIATQLVLGLVEPQSSGLGGGAFVLYYDAEHRRLHSYDAREVAPGLAGPFLFYKKGKAVAFKEAQLGGLSVGVPGVPMLLSDLHQMHGNVTWMELFEDAIHLAKEGFEVSPRLHKVVGDHQDDLKKFDETAAYFLDTDGHAWSAGHVLKNSAYEKTLKDFAFHGAGMFYRGRIADDIVSAVQNNSVQVGLLNHPDFRGYAVKERKPVCAPFDAYIVCSMGEPSSGGLTILQALSLIESYKMHGEIPDRSVLNDLSIDQQKVAAMRVYLQASALAFSDRNAYMADPDFVNTPGEMLLDPQYIKERSALIKPLENLEDVFAGRPSLWDGPLYEQAQNFDKPGTTHISIVDKAGNVLSMTSTIESAFGSHIMVDGFLLNNQLTDFSFEPFQSRDKKALVANMVEGGKRPRSSMAPTIAFRAKGYEPALAIGSAGGSRIIGFVLQRLVSILSMDEDVQKALNSAHILSRGNRVEMEKQGARDTKMAEAFRAEGLDVFLGEMVSGLTAIYIHEDGALEGAVDPRREGVAMGK